MRTQDAGNTAAVRRWRPYWPHLARRGLGGGVRLLLFLLIFNTLVLPQIAGARKSLERLGNVNPALVLMGLALELLALASYAFMTRAALPPHSARPNQLVRIQLATKAVTNTVPGGSAAGSALGYRLLTTAGVRGADAGFALAAGGIGSAVVLNLILWFGLLISIPLRGFNKAYVTAALAGALLMAFFGALVFALAKGENGAERVVRAVARRVRFLDEDKLGQAVRRVASRVSDLTTDPGLLKRAVMWATLNWVLDAASLWVFLRAFGGTADPDALIVAFGLANVLAAIPLTPGGLGIFETTLAAALLGFGLPRASVGLGVAAYRLAAYWLPIPLGGAAYVSLRFGPWSLARHRRLGSMRDVARETLATHEDRMTWVERYGRPPRRPDAANGPKPEAEQHDDGDPTVDMPMPP